MSRGGYKIYKHENDEVFDENNQKLSPMLSNFAKSIVPQNAVEKARARNAQSFMQDLISIMNNKPRYATVADAVQDMQERTGLKLHLENIKSANNVKKAEFIDIEIPESLKKYNFGKDIINYVKNNIKNTNALGISVPSLQHDILSIFGKDGLKMEDVMNEQVARYLSDCIYEAQKMLPSNHESRQIGDGVGKDLLVQETDPWAGLMPSK